MNNYELADIACKHGDNIKTVIRDFYLNCMQNGFYDMKENACWFVDEYDLDASLAVAVLDILMQVDLEYKNKFNQCRS